MQDYIRKKLFDKFEFQSYGHALEILHEAFPTEWNEIQDCLENLYISVDDLRAAGGNETAIPKSLTMCCIRWVGVKSESQAIFW